MMVMLNLAGVPFCWNDREREGGGGKNNLGKSVKVAQLSGCQHISGSYPICATWEENMEIGSLDPCVNAVQVCTVVAQL